MRLVAVVLAWNARDDVAACLESLRGLETICVDNASTDGSPELVAERFPEVELVRNEQNLDFAAGNNVGIRRALERGVDWVLLVNDDAVAEPGLADALAAAASARPDAGVLACAVLDERGGVQFGGMKLWPRLGHHRSLGTLGDELRDTGSATGAAMAVSRAAIDAVGLLDGSLVAYVEEVDWCLRIRAAGFAVVLVPAARVRHRGSSGSERSLYYDTRNTIVVWERHWPLPLPLRGLRRGAIVAAHLAQSRGRHAGAILAAWRDARAGRLGPRSAK